MQQFASMIAAKSPPTGAPPAAVSASPPDGPAPPAPAAGDHEHPPSTASWSAIGAWDKPPDAPPPPPPPSRKGKGEPALAKRLAPAVGPSGPAGCTDPSCTDPMCGPMRRREGSGPRAADLEPEMAKLQESLLGLAKDDRGEDIRRLIATYKLSAQYGNSIGQTALHVAAIWNSLKAGDVLLDHGAKINARNDLNGATPLHMAAMRGRREFCALLLTRGADATLREDSGRLAADVADDETLAVFLRRAAAGKPALSPGDAEPEPEAQTWDPLGWEARAAAAASAAADSAQAVPTCTDPVPRAPAANAEGKSRRIRAAELKEQGNDAFRSDDFERAARLYTEATTVDGENYVAFGNLSNCHGKMGNWELAAAFGLQCVELEPTYRKGWLRLAAALLELRDASHARGAAEGGLGAGLEQPNEKPVIKQLQTILNDAKRLISDRRDGVIENADAATLQAAFDEATVAAVDAAFAARPRPKPEPAATPGEEAPNGDWDAVHKRASEALAAGHPAQCQLHMLRGEAWLFCGNNVGAMAQFEAAVRAGFGASPGFFAHARSLDRSLASAVARALRYRALLLAWASRYRAAESDAKVSVTLDPELAGGAALLRDLMRWSLPEDHAQHLPAHFPAEPPGM